MALLKLLNEFMYVLTGCPLSKWGLELSDLRLYYFSSVLSFVPKLFNTSYCSDWKTFKLSYCSFSLFSHLLWRKAREHLTFILYHIFLSSVLKVWDRFSKFISLSISPLTNFPSQSWFPPSSSPHFQFGKTTIWVDLLILLKGGRRWTKLILKENLR